MLPAIAPPELEEERIEEHVPLYHLILLDDDTHTYDYVIEMLQTLFLLSKTEAFRKAVEVDTEGRVVILTCERAAAEFGRDQIHAYGPDPRMSTSRGSMRAIVEPADGAPARG